MKKLISCFLFLIPFLSICQDSKWKEQVIEYSPKLLSEVNGFAKIDLTRFADEFKVNPSARKSKNETLIFANDVSSYYQKTNEQNENIEISKKTNNIEQSIVLKNAAQAYAINSQGCFLTNDFSHGSGSSIDFYSPDLKQLNTYRPFASGYTDFNFGSLNNLVCLYTKEDYRSTTFKLTLLDQTGTVKQEKEFFSEDQVVFNIKITKKNILIFMHVYNSTINNYSSRILSFDFYLNEVWRKNIDGRIGFDPLTKIDSKEILINVGNDILSINELDGLTKWTISIPSSNSMSTNLIEILKMAFINSDKYIVSTSGHYSKSHNQFHENLLYILNSTDGTVVFQKKLGSSLSELKILPMDTGFIIVKDSQLFEIKQ